MKRYLCLSLCFLLMITSLIYIKPAELVYAATQQELEDKINALDGEIAANKDKLNSLAEKKESQQEYLDTLESQITAVEDKVTALEKQIQSIDNEISGYDNQIKQLKNEIAILEDEINLANEEITSTQESIEASKDELSAKLRASYMTGDYSTLKLLMGSDNLASFLTRIEMMKRVSEEETRVINEFKEKVEKLKATKEKLETDRNEQAQKQAEIVQTRETRVSKKKELLAKQAEYDASVTELEGSYSEVESFIAQLDKDSATYQAYIKKLQAEKEAADKEIERIILSYQATSNSQTTETTLYASNSDPNSPASTQPGYSSGESWAWPLGSASCYISSGYGNRDASISGWSFHGGIDITGGVYGKPVYASRSGTVIAAIWSNTGYGNYCVIDHGDGYSTVYAHCSSLSVTKGQYVSKGQHIANVGSTGNSTGPHLHFEVRYNGAKQNPLNYVKKP